MDVFMYLCMYVWMGDFFFGCFYLSNSSMIRQNDGISWCASGETKQLFSRTGALMPGLFVYHVNGTLEAQERGSGHVG